MDNGIPGFLYTKTPSGITKITQIILSLCGLVCSFAQDKCWTQEKCIFFGVICLLSLIYAIFILVGSIANLDIGGLPWPKIDLLAGIVLAILIFTSTATITPTVTAINVDALKAAAVFGYLNGCSYFGISAAKIVKNSDS